MSSAGPLSQMLILFPRAVVCFAILACGGGRTLWCHGKGYPPVCNLLVKESRTSPSRWEQECKLFLLKFEPLKGFVQFVVRECGSLSCRKARDYCRLTSLAESTVHVTKLKDA